jgi:hypothetical protein
MRSRCRAGVRLYDGKSHSTKREGNSEGDQERSSFLRHGKLAMVGEVDHSHEPACVTDC